MHQTNTVFDVVKSPFLLSPCKFDKILVVDNIIEKNLYKIFVLEIISKKIFLIFLFIRYYTAIIKQSSSYFYGKFILIICFCKLLMKLAKAISSSSSCTSTHLKSIAFYHYQDLIFLSVSSISNGSFSFLSFSSKLLLYLVKVLVIGPSVAKILWNIFILCAFTALLKIRQF